MFDWILQNKEWLFSGLGLVVIGWFITWLINRNKKTGQLQKSGKNSTNIQAGNDINIKIEGSGDDRTTKE
jgi:hypothetical protein